MKITVTLNRAHKIVERLKAKRNELKSELIFAARPKTISVVKGTNVDSIVGLDSASIIRSNIGLIAIICGTISNIKTQVGKENARLNIGELLANIEGQTFIKSAIAEVIKAYKGIDSEEKTRRYYGEPAKSDAAPISRDTLTSIFSSIEKAEETPEPYTVKISRFSPQVLAFLEEEHTVQSNSCFADLDAVSDLNAKKISIEIPDEVLQYTGYEPRID